MTPSKPLTASEIAALPDRELDALVAREVMGFHVVPSKTRCLVEMGGGPSRYFEPATDPRAMMEVLAHMENAHGADVDFFTGYDNKQKRYHQVHFHGDLSADTESDVCGIARLPRMVAEAALLAVRAKKGGGE